MDALTDDQVRQQVLDKIASGEANSYTTIYGGHQFTSLDQHPNIPVQITSGPNAGKYSTAAGRYQFLYPTWQDQATRLGLTDFSPASQDAAAWDLAQRTYRAQTGRSIVADAKAGNVDWNSLGGTWESLKGKPAGPAPTGTGQPAAPGAAPSPGNVLPNNPPVPQAPAQDPTQAMYIRTLLQQVMAPKKPPVQPTLVYDPSKYANMVGGQLRGG